MKRRAVDITVMLLTPPALASINIEDRARFAGLSQAVAAHLRRAVVAGPDAQALSNNDGSFDTSSGPLTAPSERLRQKPEGLDCAIPGRCVGFHVSLSLFTTDRARSERYYLLIRLRLNEGVTRASPMSHAAGSKVPPLIGASLFLCSALIPPSGVTSTARRDPIPEPKQCRPSDPPKDYDNDPDDD